MSTIKTDEIVAALVNALADDVERIDTATPSGHSKEVSRPKYRPTAALISLRAWLDGAIGGRTAGELRASAAELKSVDTEVAGIIEKVQR